MCVCVCVCVCVYLCLFVGMEEYKRNKLNEDYCIVDSYLSLSSMILYI